MRQINRQVLFIDGANQTRRLPVVAQLVQNRKRLAPKPLPAEEPVPQLVVHGLAAETCLGQIGDDQVLKVGGCQAVKAVGVDRNAVADETLLACEHSLAIDVVAIAWIDYSDDGQTKLPGE